MLKADDDIPEAEAGSWPTLRSCNMWTCEHINIYPEIIKTFRPVVFCFVWCGESGAKNHRGIGNIMANALASEVQVPVKFVAPHLGGGVDRYIFRPFIEQTHVADL